MRVKIIFVALFIFNFNLLAQGTYEDYYNKAGTALYDARVRFADILLPEKFQEAVEYFNQAIEIKTEENNASESVKGFKECLKTLEEIQPKLERRLKAFDSVLKLRQRAFELNADELAVEAWSVAEENFADAVETFNDGKIEASLSQVPKIENNYKDAITYASKAEMLIYRWQPLITSLENSADVIAPDEFEDGMDLYYEALEEISDEESLVEIQSLIVNAENKFSEATSKAKRFANRFPDLVQARRSAEMSQAEIYAPEAWRKAEELFASAVESYYDREMIDAQVFADKGRFKYGFASNRARKNYYVKDAELQIKLAKEEGAEKYAPETLKESITNLEVAKNMLIESIENFNKSINLIMLASQQAKEAKEISKIVKGIENGTTTWEDELLNHNVITSQKKFLAPKHGVTKKTVVYNAMKAFARAKDAGAEKYSPKLYKQAREMLSFAEKELEKKDYSLSDAIRMADQAEDLSLQALKVAEIVSKIEEGKLTPEEEIKSWQLFANVAKPLAKKSTKKKGSKKESASTQTPVANPEALFSSDEAVFLSHGSKTVVRLVGIKFASGSSLLNKKSREVLDKFIEYLNYFPNAKLEVRCYTDNVGAVRFNEKLSRKRAQAIKKYIVEHSDISPNDILTIGMGPAYPIATNRTRAGRAKNRRVEITVIKK